MKVFHEQPLDFFDVDHKGKLQLSAAARFFQSMATRHSHGLGLGHAALAQRGVTWLLHRLEVRFLRYPTQGENIRLSTWSRGFKRHLGLREYALESKGELLVRATSVWVFYHVLEKRLCRVLPEVAEKYEFEPETWFSDELYGWTPPGKIQPEVETRISLRHADFDLNGHVNNTQYPGFLETLYQGLPQAKSGGIRGFKIRFRKEIPLGATAVAVGCANLDSTPVFNIRAPGSEGVLHADGEFYLK